MTHKHTNMSAADLAYSISFCLARSSRRCRGASPFTLDPYMLFDINGAVPIYRATQKLPVPVSLVEVPFNQLDYREGDDFSFELNEWLKGLGCLSESVIGMDLPRR